MKSSTSEMTWKTQVADKYFKQFTRRYDEKFIDLLVEPAAEGLFAPFLWAEAKKQITSVPLMYAQLLLTIKPAYDKGEKDVPKYLGVFDNEKICFVEFYHLWDIINANGFNWKDKPSNVSQPNENIVAKFLTPDIVNEFVFGKDDAELKKFIKENFTFTEGTAKLQITKNNFLHVYNRWEKDVRPTIAVSVDTLQGNELIDGDFYLADVLSENNVSVKKTLKVVLRTDIFHIVEKKGSRLFTEEIHFTDGRKAHTKFWNRYHRPPAEKYWNDMIDRRELLVPQDIREQKGSFFTPQIWVQKSQEYLEKTFGENWQDEYYIWDCCCGTGNLEVGLTNPDKVWASTLDRPDVNVIYELIESGRNLYPNHVFQFDFLNDDFVPQSKDGKIPDELFGIISDPKKQRKLIIYMNPPYAESTNKTTITGTGKNKGKIKENKVYEQFQPLIGTAAREKFAQFFIRIYDSFPLVKLASFSTLKYINAQNFAKFRVLFKSEFKCGFICPANTFDNVNGQFPIGFFIWDLENKKTIRQIYADVLYADKEVTHCWKTNTKKIAVVKRNGYIIDWLREFYDKENERIAYFRIAGVDMQHNSHIFITLHPSANDIKKSLLTNITGKNLIPMSVYLAVRQVIEHHWTNDRDQFLYPDDKWKRSKKFQNNCLMFTLFHSQNRIKSADGINHWIPFRAKEVKAENSFRSDFMVKFLAERGRFGESAQAVFAAGKALWTYYHETIKSSTVKNDAAGHFNDASLYDIRAYFKGTTNGRVNAKSKDETFTKLDTALKDAMKVLAEEIKPCVYEYGFLME